MKGYDKIRHLMKWLNLPMMTSSNGNIFRVTGPLWGNSVVTGEFPARRPVTRSFDVFFDLHKRWVNTRESGDLRCHRAHYDVIVILLSFIILTDSNNPETAGNAWVGTHHYGYRCPGARAPGHQYQQCLMNIRCVRTVFTQKYHICTEQQEKM